MGHFNDPSQLMVQKSGKLTSSCRYSLSHYLQGFTTISIRLSHYSQGFTTISIRLSHYLQGFTTIPGGFLPGFPNQPNPLQRTRRWYTPPLPFAASKRSKASRNLLSEVQRQALNLAFHWGETTLQIGSLKKKHLKKWMAFSCKWIKLGWNKDLTYLYRSLHLKKMCIIVRGPPWHRSAETFMICFFGFISSALISSFRTESNGSDAPHAGSQRGIGCRIALQRQTVQTRP